MTTEQQPTPSTDKLAATLAELEAERRRRVDAGQWSRGVRPILVAIPDGETLETAQQRAIYKYLAEHPDAPKAIAAYDWIQVVIVDPKPTVELPSERLDYAHKDAVDVTPPPFRPPAAPPLRPTPRSHNNAGIPETIHRRALRQLHNFESDIYDPADAPLRYPRGRNGR